MFSVNEDLSIYATRGDIVFFNVTAHDHGYPYKFKPGDIVRFSAVAKKDVGTVEIEKDFPVSEASETVFIFLEEKDTKIGEPINKHKDYWYEVVLNPDTMPQTLIGNDEDGPKLFRLFPEASEKVEEPIEEEEIPVVDCKLDMTSHRPVENQAVAIAIAQLVAAIEELKGSENVQTASEQVEGSVFNADGKIERLAILTIDAYGVAVKNGFKGTVDEWLASLRGEKGDIGEAFTYEDFTEEQLEALKGSNGFSPIVQVFPKVEVIYYPDGTMVTKEIGYTIRITDSEGYQDFDILHGDKGEKGADGTMTFEDLTDAQRESLRGDKGDKGDTGDSGVYILSEGETLEDAPEDADVVYDPFFDTEAIPGGDIDVEGAVPGQTIAVKTVDANGKPTEWEAVDFPEGGGAKAFYVTITGKDGVYTADKTVEEVNEAYNAGCALYAMVTAQIENFAVTNSVWNLANAADSWYVFSTIENRHFLSAFITSRGVSMHIQKLAAAADIPTALPNPNALTLTGAVEATYDGSGAVSVEIPASAFYVTITGDDDVGYTADKTVAEITEAYEAGKLVYCKYAGNMGDMFMPFVTFLDGGAVFCASVVENAYMAVVSDELTAIQIFNINDLVEIPEYLPSPGKLTFNGAVSGSYNGSGDVTITIPTVPTVDDILAALPTWNGGSY